MTKDNLALWSTVFATAPEHTKGFSRTGGFKGTAIKPFWLIKRATETFGPCGIGWGWEELENKMVAGVWCSKVRLWYKLDLLVNGAINVKDATAAGHIEQWGQTVMEGANKNGAFVDEEAPKKAVTDAVTKCLSYLGFGGDVHMGLFDDSKYVEAATAKKETAKSRNERFEFVKKAIASSDDPAGTWHDYLAEINEFKLQDETFYDDLVQTGSKRKKQLAEAENVRASYGEGFADANNPDILKA